MAQYHQACLVCGSEQLRDLKGYEKDHLCKCQSCGMVFSRMIPTLDELNEYYSKYSYADDQYLSPITIKRYHEILDGFEPYRKHNRLLDVGCGMGFFLEQARERGWEVYGTEYSPTAIEICEKKGITMKQGAINSADFGDMQFDVVTSFEVIEHINNPHEDMEHITRLMRPGGLFYLTTPNFNALGRYQLKGQFNIFAYPEHLSYYSPATLHRLFKQFGLRKKKLTTTGISITRMKISQGKSDQRIVSETSDDEKLRVKIEQKPHLQLAKKVANGLLGISGTGLTIKAWYQKPA